ncbi:phytoene/squalene synthase family protein [Altererythrobacter buctensis]|uniref:Phytoene/squalene synthase family protein n=1 Tax=Alteraurantiacibacter buctensis TaxID=1503981 RepID=A0A844Z1L9_9SPHN|nr:phytoene/squalene synthase family protein [Alteraurantiacibacter buctensis]
MAGGGHPRQQLVAAAAESIAKGSKSFARASQLFDRQTRERAQLLYAWCRRCDDIADGQDHGGELHHDGSDAKDRVEAMRVLTHRAIDGQPTADLAFDALGQVASECGLTHEMADDVIDGFALDADEWRPRTEGDLMRYCFHVAGAVGVMMARVMGVPADDEETLDRACDLGLAFQLGNIARDVSEDDAGGRCYLPVEWLVEMDIPPGQHMKPAYRQELVVLVRRLVDLAQEHEAAARLGAARLPFRSRWAVLAAANIYGAIGREVRAKGGAAWDHRVYTSKAAKLRFVAQAFWQALANQPAPAKMPKWTRAGLEAMADAAPPD